MHITFNVSEEFNVTKKGFSIIEFLIYIAILAIAIAAIGLILSNIFRVGARTDVVQEVSHNGRFAMQRIGQVIRESSGITEPETEGNRLELLFDEEAKNPTVFYVSEGKLIIKEGNGEDIELTTSRVAVKKLVLKKVSDDSVRVEMNISFYNPQGLPEYEFTSFFTSSFTLKN
jgi:type II secretory pathway pseudopilin PulG